ncbi:hypothetical protein ILYODFUR_010512 [Ilyodon furcidens]|uniref:Uncharacterized protein n=1 Tax=Ilyodon furcidens TaxID=33524 RepID=A0ABV0U4A4_9TELE
MTRDPPCLFRPGDAVSPPAPIANSSGSSLSEERANDQNFHPSWGALYVPLHLATEYRQKSEQGATFLEEDGNAKSGKALSHGINTERVTRELVPICPRVGRWSTPWTSRRSIKGQHRDAKDKQPCTNTPIHT